MQTLTLLLVAMVTLTRVTDAGKQSESKEVDDLVKRGLLCASGWTLYNWNCYRFVPRRMTWSDAEKNCQSMNAHLASVHSAEEYHQIQKMIADQTQEQPETWIGGSNAQGGQWLWIDGTTFLFSYWCQGEPNNPGSQLCLQMNYSDKKCWDNLECNNHRPFVCVKSWSLFG